MAWTTGAALMLALVSAAVPAAEPLPPASIERAWGKVVDNHIYAQKLVNDLMAADPTLLSVALHATRPGKKIPEIVAHTQDLIGKEDSPEDVAMIAGDQTVIGPEMVEHTTQVISRMVVHAPLRDHSGAIIGLAVFSFKRRPGLEKIAVQVRSEAMLIELSQNIASPGVLFVQTAASK